jgi:hypothetical protein
MKYSVARRVFERVRELIPCALHDLGLPHSPSTILSSGFPVDETNGGVIGQHECNKPSRSRSIIQQRRVDGWRCQKMTASLLLGSSPNYRHRKSEIAENIAHDQLASWYWVEKRLLRVLLRSRRITAAILKLSEPFSKWLRIGHIPRLQM